MASADIFYANTRFHANGDMSKELEFDKFQHRLVQLVRNVVPRNSNAHRGNQEANEREVYKYKLPKTMQLVEQNSVHLELESMRWGW